MPFTKSRGSIEDLLHGIAGRLPALKAFEVHDPGVTLFDPALGPRLSALRSLLDMYFRVDINFASRVPRSGGALLVGNHGRTGLDAFIFAAVALDKLGRPVRALTDRWMFRVPKIRDYLAAFGAVPGTRENAVAMLKDGQLVVVYPGGTREVVKKPNEAYQLQWGDRLGFIRVAQEAGVPIIPFAGIGVEELYQNVPAWDMMGNSWLVKRIEELAHNASFSLPSPPPIPPVVGLGPLPNPVKLTFLMGEPIETHDIDPKDEVAMQGFQWFVQDRLKRLLELGLQQRNEDEMLGG